MKKTVFTSILCILLLAIMVLTTACGGNGNKGETTTANQSTSGETPGNGGGGNQGGEVVEDLTKYYPSQDIDMGDREFVQIFGGITVDWRNQDNSGDPIANIHYKRRLAFEEWYNAELLMIGVTNVVTSLQNAQMGDVAYDFVSTHPTDGITTILTKGLCADLLSIESLSLQRDWFSQSFVKNYTYNGKLYVVAHDGTIDGQGFYGLAFNKDLYATYNLDYDIYDIVNKGEWTVETLKNIVLETASNSNAEDKVYGLLFNLRAAQRWMWGFNGQILEKNVDGTFSLSMTTKNMEPMVSALSELIYNSGDVLPESYSNAQFPESKIFKSFTGGKGIFVTWDLGNLYNYLRDIEFEVGYAPLPKLSSTQKEYAIISPAGFEGIPSCATNKEESGIYFEHYALYSHINLKPAFFETILGGRLSDHQEDYEMLNLLHTKKVYDLGYTLDGNEGTAVKLFEDLLSGGPSNSMAVAAKLKTMQKYLNDLCRIANGEIEG